MVGDGLTDIENWERTDCFYSDRLRRKSIKG